MLLWEPNIPDTDLETTSPNQRPKQDPVISFGHRWQINSVVSEPTGCKAILDLVLVTKENSIEEPIIKIILGCMIKFSERISKHFYD